VRTSAIALVVLLLVRLFLQRIAVLYFDPLGAQAIGLPVSNSFSLTASITLTIIASVQSSRRRLVVSLLIGPGITAYLLVKELHQMMGYGAIIGVISSDGMYISLQSPIWGVDCISCFWTISIGTI